MSLPWLRSLWQNIAHDHQQGTLAHAHCLTWQPDLGTQALVEEWVRLLLCTAGGKRACGQCKSCLLHRAGNHPDYYQLRSDEGRVIGVEPVRELLAKLQHTPNQAGAKVVWLHDAEKLSVTAANALLKTLEEPTQDTYFIVTPERTERLLPTLRSRMQLQRLQAPTLAEVEQWLSQRLQRVLSAEEQQHCQRYFQRPLALLQWLEDGQFPRDYLLEFSQCMTTDQALPQPSKNDWLDWLTASEQWLQEMIRVQQGIAQEQLRLPEQQQAHQQWLLARGVGVSELSAWAHLCYAIRQQTAEQSGLNGPLLLHGLWMRWR